MKKTLFVIKMTMAERKKTKIVKKVVKRVAKKAVKKITRKKKVELERHVDNPIIQPRSHKWESKATFNPSAFLGTNRVHLVYRAIGDDDSSVLGYAASRDGYHVDERPPYSIYQRDSLSKREKGIPPILNYTSGGGWNGGCEDPRLTRIGDMVYMLYTAFDGWGSLRIAMTSIKLGDFENHRWRWEKPVLISPPGEIHKNWVLFPEKINGKFAILHSFYPRVLIDYFDSLDELDGETKFLRSNNTRPVDPSRTWDSWFRGVGPAPIRITEGWLVLYHAMDHRNPDRYRIGALILDAKDPTKVLYRSKEPILSPEKGYENNGYKWGVVYSCGAVIKDGVLFVYYGGADMVIGVATIKLSDLVKDLKNNIYVRF